MKINQAMRTKTGEWEFIQQTPLNNPLVLVFGDRMLLEDEGIYDEIRKLYPEGEIVFGST